MKPFASCFLSVFKALGSEWETVFARLGSVNADALVGLLTFFERELSLSREYEQLQRALKRFSKRLYGVQRRFTNP